MVSTRRPTMEDVARRAGVSRALVSLAINDSPRIGDASKQLILKAADDLGYRPNLAARNLASSRTGTIGVFLNDLHNPFFADVFDGLEAAALEADRRTLLTTARARRSGEREAIDVMVDHRVDGIVLVSPRVPSAVIARAARTTPIVVIGRVVRDEHVDCVTNDDVAGARLVVEHLASLGHRRIVHIDGGTSAGSNVRRAGFVRAAKELSIASAETVEGETTEEAGRTVTEQLLESGRVPTAIFAANDIAALGVIAALIDAGLSVPDDVSVVGYDNSALAKLSHPRLTSVDQSTDHIGRTAMRVLAERIEGRTKRRVELVTPTLVVRRTTAPPVRAVVGLRDPRVRRRRA